MSGECEELTERVNGYYSEKGYTIDTYKEGMLRGIHYIKDKATGGAICNSDVELMFWIKKMMTIKSIFAVGNAFGYSTIILGEIWKGIPLDVIDAEVEGADNHLGSEITWAIAKDKGLNIRAFSL